MVSIAPQLHGDLDGLAAARAAVAVDAGDMIARRFVVQRVSEGHGAAYRLIRAVVGLGRDHHILDGQHPLCDGDLHKGEMLDAGIVVAA